jgi:hypothetical protein
MTNPSNSAVQNLLPVQAYFNLDGSFNTFIGQGNPFYATANPIQSGLTITNSTLDSSPIGSTSPSTGVFTNIATTTGTVLTQPTAANDIVNLLALQSYAAGISWKQPCAVATLTNITLSGLQTIDGYTTLANDRVLVKNQSNAANNGIYIASATAWTRALDADAWQEFVSAITFIEYGTQAGGAWFCTAVPGGTLGVTALNWSQFTTSATYSAGTGLTLTGFEFKISNTGATAGTYGSASRNITQVVNAQGQITNIFDQAIDIAASQIGSGTIDTARISGSYTGITGVGTLTAGTWNAGTIGVAYGGTGAATLTGYIKGAGTSAFTASATIPTTDLSGTISNAQLANSTISGVALGGNLFSLTAGTNITFNTGTTYNGSAAITINATSTPQVYPGAGIANSTGSAWGTSYSTTGSGTVVALATSPSFTTPVLGTVTSGNFSTGTFTWPTFNQNTSGTAAGLSATLVVGSGGTGVTTLTGLAYGNGTSAFTAATAAQVVSVIGSTAVTNATNAANATNIGITDDTTTATTCYPTWVTTTTGNLPQKTASTKLSFIPSTGVLSATTFSGAGTSLTGTAASLTAGNATTAAAVTGGYVSSAVAGTAISVSGATGAVTINNTGVTSNVAGTGVTVSGATGAVTISIGQAVATSSNTQFNSLGVGTAGSGTAGEIRATNNVTAYYSDDRMKTRLGKIESALDKLRTLDGFYYEANELAQSMGYEVKKEVGVSAQQVQAIMPEVVAPAPIDENYLTVRYERLVPLLIEAIKELEAKLNAK